MELNKSKFLSECKDSLKELIKILNEDFKYVSILGTDCQGKNYSVYKKGAYIGSGFNNERGFVVRVYNGVNYSEFSFNEISKENINSIAKEIRKKFNMMKSLDLRKKSYDLIEEEAIKETMTKEVKKSPMDLMDKDIINILEEVKNIGLGKSDKIIDFKVSYEYTQVNKIFISNKKELEQSYMWSTGDIICLVSSGENSKYSYKGISGLKGAEILDEFSGKIEEAVQEALSLLEATPIIPGEYEVICNPDVSGLIAHEAFGHGVEMDMFIKERAKSKEYIGKQIASPLVTMHDGAKGVNHTASYGFDDEGVLANDTIIIKNGILERGISDSLTAFSLNEKPTGNGRRESFERKVYTRMTNTYFQGGEDTLEDMIKSIEYGFLLESSGSGMEDPKNWGIQCIVNVAREIKDGKFTGKIHSPIILTGYVPDLLKSISMISKDVSIEGVGFCGKGYKEFIKVSCGGPYIKAKVRLG
ncbi:TldD/PmbA family protein [Clostridium hydrogeniformans]|uniref:TldD/PmbA family protein n=1 Tax=Clostridium hydrogeniformans TaxID=349933 RepID=UPI000488C503|nr:TldD/PmbA family protein [Clostridium hydrogeniformans]